MVIDTHVHMGCILDFSMPEDTILDSMKKYGISFSLVSNIEGCEVDHQQKPISKEIQVSQKQVNEKVLAFAKRNPDKIGALLWTKPGAEGADEEFERLLLRDREYIYGIKVHPYHCGIAFDDGRVEKYIQLAEQHQLPVVTHTASDEASSPKKVYEMALKYPKVPFIMYHMGLGTNHLEAIKFIGDCPNLYGDVSWIEKEDVYLAIERCGYQKILFGTDNPINGLDTYGDKTFYEFYWKEACQVIGNEAYQHLMYKNAKGIFKIG